MKEMFLDIGELGWSLYLSAHMKWLKKEGQDIPSIMTLPSRECLYEGLAPSIHLVPDSFYKKFDLRQQNCFVLYKVPIKNLKAYFNSNMPKGYRLSEEQRLEWNDWTHVFRDEQLFEPYPSKVRLDRTKEILVFPRWRVAVHFRKRNLPADFYGDLINRICAENKDCVVRAMGTLSGAYNIPMSRQGVAWGNYRNWVGKTSSLQAVIDKCQIAICTVGGTSVLPKLAMLQGVPSFVIGHEPKRFEMWENWRGTKVGFHKVEGKRYHKIDFERCIVEVLSFIKEVRNETTSN